MTGKRGLPILAPADAEEIRRLWKLGLMSQPALAEKYHCSRRTISRIVKAETYRGHVDTTPRGTLKL